MWNYQHNYCPHKLALVSNSMDLLYYYYNNIFSAGSTRTWLRYVRVFAIANCLSSVTFVCPTQEVETFGIISSTLCILAILWPPRKNFTEIVPVEPLHLCIYTVRHSVYGVKRKRSSKVERRWTYRRLYLICQIRVSHLLMSFLFYAVFHCARQKQTATLLVCSEA